VVPQANVSLAEVNTGIARNTITDGDGNYNFLNLLPGNYVVTVKRPGFQEFKTEVFELVARQDQRANATLTLGAQATQVQVVSAAPLINTENGSVSDATRQLDLINAPYNFRTFNTSPLAVLYIMPQVVEAAGGARFRHRPAIRHPGRILGYDRRDRRRSLEWKRAAQWHEQ
jgi:hypothetical protein